MSGHNPRSLHLPSHPGEKRRPSGPSQCCWCEAPLEGSEDPERPVRGFSLGPLPNVKRKKEGKKEEKGREEEKEEEEGRKERERNEQSVEKEGGGRLGDLSQGPRCPSKMVPLE